ncbi:MAG: hypothetical protein RMK61_04350 [Bacteroidota bacterium]|nr:hypothetical protein [Bacteroidota bacterium]MDW8137664.1 hypothetical protein [Bacteroidota bacterium]
MLARLLSWGPLYLIALGAVSVAAQPGRLQEPFYREERACPEFFDALLVRAEVGLAPVGTWPLVADRLALKVPLLLNLQLEGRLKARSTWGASWDLVRAISLSTPLPTWLWARYHWRNEDTDYAFRLAFDPALGPTGFRRVDVAFISSMPLSIWMASDFALGLRSLWDRRKYVQLSDSARAPLPGLNLENPAPPSDLSVTIGREIHLQQTYWAYLDPARSALFVGLQATAGRYSTLQRQAVPDSNSAPAWGEILGGQLWLRLGGRWARPLWIVGGYLAIPVYRHSLQGSSAPQVGVQLTVR